MHYHYLRLNSRESFLKEIVIFFRESFGDSKKNCCSSDIFAIVNKRI